MYNVSLLTGYWFFEVLQSQRSCFRWFLARDTDWASVAPRRLYPILPFTLLCAVFHGEETGSDDDESVDGRREIKVYCVFCLHLTFKFGVNL